MANASPIMRIQNLEGPGETSHVTTVVRHQNATIEGVVEEGGATQRSKMVEEWDLDELKTFRLMNNMRRLQREKQLHKEKEWNRVSVHIDQTKDSDEEEEEVLKRCVRNFATVSYSKDDTNSRHIQYSLSNKGKENPIELI